MRRWLVGVVVGAVLALFGVLPVSAASAYGVSVNTSSATHISGVMTYFADATVSNVGNSFTFLEARSNVFFHNSAGHTMEMGYEGYNEGSGFIGYQDYLKVDGVTKWLHVTTNDFAQHSVWMMGNNCSTGVWSFYYDNTTTPVWTTSSLGSCWGFAYDAEADGMVDETTGSALDTASDASNTQTTYVRPGAWAAWTSPVLHNSNPCGGAPCFGGSFQSCSGCTEFTWTKN